MNFDLDYDKLNRQRSKYQQQRQKELETEYQKEKSLFLRTLADTDKQCVKKITDVYNQTGKLPKRPYQFAECNFFLRHRLSSEEHRDRLKKELVTENGPGGFVSIEEVHVSDRSYSDPYGYPKLLLHTQTQFDKLSYDEQKHVILKDVAFIVPNYAKQDFESLVWK